MTPLKKLLVANRAEIAARICRTARRRGLSTVAVFSDVDAELPYVEEADQAVRLPGAAAVDTYLNIEALLRAAAVSGADAVHPGYGFLSENAPFARACLQAGLTFVGPAPEAIEAMGSKTAAKDLMAAAGVPVLPGHTVEEGDDLSAARAIGYPLLVKAVFGGGGRGMRIVRDPDGLSDAVDSAEREAEAAFGDGTVFLERFVEAPRHVEVQVVGDHHGSVVALFERECSIQRRHQKVIEEAPSPAVDAALRATLSDAAVAAAQAIGYVGAGTVEFVLAPDRSFYFLEVNTRLQVEHPVTEMVTGLDLVELQLAVAEGRPLPEQARLPTLSGHAIEARLYAEDVRQGFMPSSGTLQRLRFPDSTHLRVDAGYRTGSVVSTRYDAMLAKVIAWAPERRDAAHLLARGLKDSEVHGVAHNGQLLQAVLDHQEFLAGNYDTGFFDRHRVDELLSKAAPGDATALHAIAATLAACSQRLSARAVQRHVPPGWRNVETAMEELVLDDLDTSTPVTVGYRFPARWRSEALATSDQPVVVEVDGVRRDVELYAFDAEAADLSLDGLRQRCRIQWVSWGSGGGAGEAGAMAYVESPLGASVFVEEERFPPPRQEEEAGSLSAPMPGSVVRVLVAPGSTVEAGQPLVVMEAMKMEHQVRAPHSGQVTEVRVTPGDQLEPGQVLIVLDGSTPGG